MGDKKCHDATGAHRVSVLDSDEEAAAKWVSCIGSNTVFLMNQEKWLNCNVRIPLLLTREKTKLAYRGELSETICSKIPNFCLLESQYYKTYSYNIEAHFVIILKFEIIYFQSKQGINDIQSIIFFI